MKVKVGLAGALFGVACGYGIVLMLSTYEALSFTAIETAAFSAILFSAVFSGAFSAFTSNESR
jgi:uncharacterized membrane protein YfcA